MRAEPIQVSPDTTRRHHPFASTPAFNHPQTEKIMDKNKTIASEINEADFILTSVNEMIVDLLIKSQEKPDMVRCDTDRWTEILDEVESCQDKISEIRTMLGCPLSSWVEEGQGEV